MNEENTPAPTAPLYKLVTKKEIKNGGTYYIKENDVYNEVKILHKEKTRYLSEDNIKYTDHYYYKGSASPENIIEKFDNIYIKVEDVKSGGRRKSSRRKSHKKKTRRNRRKTVRHRFARKK